MSDGYGKCCGEQCAENYYSLNDGNNKIQCLRSCPQEGYYTDQETKSQGCKKLKCFEYNLAGQYG